MVKWMRVGVMPVILGLLVGMGSLGVRAQSADGGVDGTVESFADNMVTLTSGESFAVTEQTRVTLVMPASIADLLPGEYVAITAQRGDDGALQASIVRALPEDSPPSRVGQFPLSGENLMTNAIIDDAVLGAVDGGELLVSFQEETDRVRITADTRIQIQSRGSLADIGPGAAVSTRVADGVAGNVSVQR